MARKTVKPPVDFEVMKLDFEAGLKMIEEFQNGAFLSKNQAKEKLLAYRKLLSKIMKNGPGAKLHSCNMTDSLVPKAEVESTDAVLPDVQKVEVPE